jgi:hypothetical protein
MMLLRLLQVVLALSMIVPLVIPETSALAQTTRQATS